MSAVSLPLPRICSDFPRSLWLLLLLSLLSLGWQPLVFGANELPQVRVAALKFGTLNWELETLKQQGFDRQQGIRLEVELLAGMSATRTALLSGNVDIIVADWIWVSRQRQQGQRLQFVPFSNAIGQVMLAKGSSISSIADLAGKRIGIAGGPASKGWLLLQARALQQDVDLKRTTEQQYGAPPLLNAALERGQIDALITFWHYGARLSAQGYPVLTDLKQVSRELGLNSELPMLGYVFQESWARQHPERVRALVLASRAARNHLEYQPQAWDAIRPLMRADDEASFEKLKLGYLEGTPSPLNPRQIDDAARMFALLQQIGGSRLMGEASQLDPAGFWLTDSR